MYWFFQLVIRPLLEALRPRTIVEIGVEAGAVTKPLVEWAVTYGSAVHSIDPAPTFDPSELDPGERELLTLHRHLSLEVLGKIHGVDLALIDGDHNWYTVISELRMIAATAAADGRRPPMVLLHDVGWPYGRRDMYYDPETIPDEHRQPYERRALIPGHSELQDRGLNAHLANAVNEGTPANGVLTAIEDFVAESPLEWRLVKVSGPNGLGVLVTEERAREDGRVNDFLAMLESASFLRELGEKLEIARVEVQAGYAARGVTAQAATEELEVRRRARVRLERQVKEVKADRDDLEQELEYRAAELREARREVRKRDDAIEDLEHAVHRAGSVKQQLAESLEEQARLQRQLADHDRVTAVLQARLDEALARDRRRHEDLGVVREALESELDEARATLHVAQHAERQLRAELGERDTELEAAGAQRERLHEALARARVDIEVAEAERDALDRRLQEALAGNGHRHLEPPAQLVAVIEELAAVREERDRLAHGLKGAPPSAAEPEYDWPPLPPSERDTQQTFLAAYGERSAEEELERARPGTVDRRGIVVPVGADQRGLPSVDVVVCVHNALEDVRICLWSLLAKTVRPFSLIVVNDGSEQPTTEMLERFAAANPNVLLISNPDPPHGYTIAANIGLRASHGDYVVLLNSDTIVTPYWLERIVEHGEARPQVGVLGPLSNAASHQSVPELRSEGAWATNPLPPWLGPDGVGLLLQRAAPRTETRLPFINGFCYAIKRKTLDAVGLLDEANFASGYCEENDFSHRARLAGFELSVVDDAYVYHVKSSSYGTEGRRPLARRNYEIFLNKHGREEIQALVREMEQNRSLAPVRAAIGDALSSHHGVGSGLLSRGDPLNVVFVLPGLGDGGSGGSHSIYQEVSGMRRLGIPARIALVAGAWDRAQRAYDDAADLFETFRDADELYEITRDAHVISATHFKSVAMVANLHKRRQDFVPTYYVQDYEPFFCSTDSADIQEAIASYTAIDGMTLFAKTHWLCNVVGERHRLAVARVMPSIDERLFVPAGPIEAVDRPLRMCAMLRPRTPRRQPHSTVAVLERLVSEHGDEVEVTTFGCGDADIRKLTNSPTLIDNHRGLLRRTDVAALLARNDVFLDMSTYQAFGRTALEAMATGCTAVVPRIGGVWEFLEDGVNGLAVNTLDVAGAYAALSSLVGDRDRLAAMRTAARATGARYSILGASVSEYVLFEQRHRALINR